jgi:hypothetical protein
MICNRCGTTVRPGQKFCAECGQSLKGISDVTEPVPVTTGSPQPAPRAEAAAGHLPAPATRTGVTARPAADGATGSATRTPALYDFAADDPDDLTAELPAPDPLTIMVSDIAAGTSSTPAPDTARDERPPADVAGSAVTAPMRRADPPAGDRTDEMPEVHLRGEEGSPRFQPTFASAIGLVVAVLAAVGAFTNLVSVSTDAAQPAFSVGDWRADDLGTNLLAAALVAIVAVLVGSVAAAFRQRWGAGLAAGGALAITGWSLLVVGLAEQPIQLAEIAVDQPTDVAFTVTITRDVGYWLLLAAAVIGVVVFFVSLGSSGRERHRSGLNPWIAALGAVSALVAAGGPLIPEGDATVSSNWSSDGWPFDQPAAFLLGRLAQVGLLAFTGVIGFLLVRRYGLALAIGGMTASVWLAITSLFDVGGAPVGPAYTNPGAPLVDVELHAVTIVGMVALVGTATVAVIAAFEQSAHEP